VRNFNIFLRRDVLRYHNLWRYCVNACGSSLLDFNKSNLNFHRYSFDWDAEHDAFGRNRPSVLSAENVIKAANILAWRQTKVHRSLESNFLSAWRRRGLKIHGSTLFRWWKNLCQWSTIRFCTDHLQELIQIFLLAESVDVSVQRCYYEV
jgi:hypothetical protein